MAKVTARKVADYILWFAHQNGELITNLKLQKLVYYAQAWYLALYDKPLFDAPIEAWPHGPVQPSLYRQFKKYTWNPIGFNPDEEPKLPKKVKQHLQEIMQEFGDYGAYTLERMTHQEYPWQHAREGLEPDQPSNRVISQEDMATYYRALVDG